MDDSVEQRPRGNAARAAWCVCFCLMFNAAPAFSSSLIVAKYSSATSLPFVIGLVALGVLIGVLFQSFFLAVFSKERMFVYFSVILVILTILQLFSTYDRFFFYLTYNRVTLTTHVLFITFLLFFEDFFALSSHSPRLSRFNRISIWIIVAFTAVFFTLKVIFPAATALHGLLDFTRELFVFYTNGLFLLTIAVAIKWMKLEASLIFIAFIPPALFTSINALNIFPFMQRFEGLIAFMMQYNQPIGLSLQAILFSLAMGNRYNQLRLQKQQALQESSQLELLNAQKTEFFLNMSHETRTPLTIILGIIRQLREGKFGDSVKSNDRLLASIERNGFRLLRLVTHMLRIERERPVVRTDRVALRSSLTTIFEDFSSIAREKSISYVLEGTESLGNLSLQMEREDFETVVLNLLSNAFKYTPDGHTVTLQGHMGEDRNLIIAVKDTGIGIPQDQTELVFERYHNIHHAHAEYQLGLGLPLVKKIMTEYGGQVSLESVLGQGTTISLTFPPSLVLVEHHEIPTSSEEDSHLGKLYASEIRLEKSPCTQPRTASNVPTLLLVEDDADMSAYIVSILQDSYRIVCASNGKEGLKILDETAVDLIISDIMMPQMDGHEFLAAVQQRENPVPLMFLTARDSLEEHIASLKNGAIRYITKPFTPQVLLATIASLLDHDRKLMEHRVQRLRQGIDRLLSELQHPLSQHDGQTLQRRLATIAHHYSLTQREMDILRLMLHGSSDKEIAQRLRLSSRTVSNHNLAIYRKVAVAGRYELLSRLYQDISL